MTVTFACGHQQNYQDGTPICERCGERRVSKVQAPRPVFRGTVSGPCVKD